MIFHFFDVIFDCGQIIDSVVCLVHEQETYSRSNHEFYPYASLYQKVFPVGYFLFKQKTYPLCVDKVEWDSLQERSWKESRRSIPCEQYEMFVVLLSYSVGDPRTPMIHTFNALFVYFAMMSSRWSYHFAPCTERVSLDMLVYWMRQFFPKLLSWHAAE